MCSTTTIQKYFIVETMNKHIEMDKLRKMWISKLKCINHIEEFLILHVLRA